jgi:hypothetical protein
LVRDLKRDRRRLRGLPVPALPTDFADRIVSALPKRARIIRHSPMTASAHRSLSPTSRWAAAAVILIALGLGASLLSILPPTPTADTALAVPRQRTTNPDQIAKLDTLAVEVGTLSEDPQRPAASERLVRQGSDASPDSTEPAGTELLGTVSSPAARLVTISAPRLVTIPIQAFTNPESRDRLHNELVKGGAINVDLFSRDPARGFERLQAALKPRGVKLIVDAVAQEAQKRKLRGHFMIYCENLTAAEWGLVLQSLAIPDKKSGELVFDTAVVTPLDNVDQAELISVLGIDPTRSETARGGAGGPSSRPPSPRPQGKSAIAAVVSPLPWRTQPTSKEVRQFIDNRPEAPDQAVDVIVTVRPPLN